MEEKYKDKKPTRSAEELLAKLRERKLTINEGDDLVIKKVIREIGYFRLSGYFGPHQNPKDTFKENITIQDILRLYEFDKTLRRITAQALKHIEINLKARLTDVMSSVYESDWYDNDTLFLSQTILQKINEKFCDNGELRERNIEIRIKLYDLLKKNINEHIDRNKEVAYVKKFKSEYGPNAIVPSWMMMECITFTDVSRLFSLIKHSPEKRSIGSRFGASTSDIFSSWLQGFSVLRNACAHHSRIWNINHFEPAFPKREDAQFITRDITTNLKKFYGISSCLLKCLYSLSTDLGDEYKQKFYKMIEKYHIDKKAMGFPTTFEKYDIWAIPS